MLILLIESGSMCKHQGSSEQSGSYTTLSSLLWLNRNMRGIKWQYTLLGKKENNSEEKEGFLSLASPSLLPETRKMEA